MADSSVDLAELEMRFAKDPTSDAFIALSAAYLEQSRFMEAMVVCKKGIRSQPDNVDGRLLLARVYAGQGKVPKALEEVVAVLEIAPSTIEAHFFLGQLHERSGRFEEAIDAFKEALILDRHHEGANQALRAKGIDFQPGPTDAELAAAKAVEDEAKRIADEAAVQAAAEAAQQAQATRAAQQAQQAQQAAARHAMPTPATGTSASGLASTPPMPAGYASPYMNAYAGPQAQGKKLGLGFSFGLFTLLLVGIIGLIVFLRANKVEKETIAMHAKEGQVSFRRDTTLGLKNATNSFGEVLKIDDEHESAAGRRAYAFQVLVNERGLRELDADSQKAIEVAEKVAAKDPHTIGARMLRASYAGKPDEAVALFDEFEKSLTEGMQTPPRVVVAAARAHLVSARLAAITGDAGLQKAAQSVQLAKGLVEKLKDLDEPSALAFAGAFWRRMGDEARARVSLDGALRLEPDHDPARAERALYVLETRDLANVALALDDVTHLLDLGKDNVGPRQRGYATLGRAELRRIGERTDEAQRDFDAAKKSLGRDPVLLFFEARWRAAEDKTSESLELIETAKKLDAVRLPVWSAYISTTNSDKKKIDVALAATKEADILFGDSLGLLQDKIDTLRKADKLADAEAYLNERVKREDVAELHRELGRIAGFKGDSAKQLDEFKIATEKSNKVARLVKAEIFTQYGAALGKKGDHEAAIEALKTAVDTAGSYPPAYYYLGVSLKESGKTGAAKESFERAAKLDPSSGAGRAAKQQLANLK